MGRDIKRVPLNFDWPIDKTWHGYLMPDDLREDQCPECGGDGYSREAKAVADTFYPHQISWTDRARADALAWHDKIGQKEVDYLLKKGRLRTWVPGENGERGSWVTLPRSAAEVNEAQRRGALDGHDGINRGLLIQFRCKRLGIPHLCSLCKGHGLVENYPGQRAQADTWEPAEPPTGEGWQVWETVSEGSPISPVFADREALIQWLMSPAYTWGTSRPLTRSQAEAFTESAWAPSGVIIDGAVLAGDAAMERM